MRKQIHTILILATAVLWGTACSRDTEIEGALGEAIGFSCVTVPTRAEGATADNMTSFRVSAVWAKSSNLYVDNFMAGQLVERNESDNWVYSPVCYMPPYGTVDFFAYSPANAAVSDFVIADHDQVSLSYDVTTDLVMQHDFMVAEALQYTGSSVALNFRHVLSSVRVEAVSESEEYTFRVHEVKFFNLYRRGILYGNTTTDGGKTTAWSWTPDYDMQATYTIAPGNPVLIFKETKEIPMSTEGTMMLLPQTVEGVSAIDSNNQSTASYVGITYDVIADVEGVETVIARNMAQNVPFAGPGNTFTFQMGRQYVFQIALSYTE